MIGMSFFKFTFYFLFFYYYKAHEGPQQPTKANAGQPGPRPWHKRAAKCMKKVQTTVCHRLRYVFLFNSLFICFTNDYLHLGMSITSETVAKGTTTNRQTTATATQWWWKGLRPWRKRAAKCRKKAQTKSLPSFEPEPLRYVFLLFNSLFICFPNDYLHLCMSTTTSVFPFFNLTKFIYN